MSSKKNENLGRLMLLMAQGLGTSLPAGTTMLHFNGKGHAAKSLVKQFHGFAKYWTAAESTQAEAHEAVRERDEVTPQAKALHDAVKLAVRALLGPKNAELRKFGLEPEKERVSLTAEERVVANAKRRATRQKKTT